MIQTTSGSWARPRHAAMRSPARRIGSGVEQVLKSLEHSLDRRLRKCVHTHHAWLLCLAKIQAEGSNGWTSQPRSGENPGSMITLLLHLLRLLPFLVGGHRELALDGHQFRHRVKGMGIEEVLTAPHSPWQNPFAERLIGSIRRECLNHVLVLGERHLRRILARYLDYYHRARTHLSLDKDSPDVRSVEFPGAGRIVQIPEVGGLHHRYVRRAA